MGKRLLSFSFLFFAIMISSTAQMVSPNDLNSAPTGPPPPISGNNNSNGPGEKRKIEIKNADFMELRTNLDVQIRRLVGNVKIKDADALFYCDSAIVNVTLNTIDAFGHVHIKKGDTIDIWGDKLFYDGNTKSGNITQNVKGYTAKDAVFYTYQTTDEGIEQKYIAGDEDFDMPASLIALFESNNFGRYANNEGELPIAFIASNHTTGGNSGSPVINANGELIGTNYDRVWEGTMSDIMYDVNRCRNISLDIRYTLFIVEKYAGATNIIQELNIVE